MHMRDASGMLGAGEGSRASSYEAIPLRLHRHREVIQWKISNNLRLAPTVRLELQLRP